MPKHTDELAQTRPERGAHPDRDAELYGAALATGTRVGDFEIIEQRARGGFATVYRARHLRLGHDVGLKVLHKMLCTSATIVKRFEQEADAVNRIRHPNIVDIYEFGELDDGRPYFVMEWLAGQDLEQVLHDRGAFSPWEALSICDDLGSALSAAHRAGIIHRDLKASNVVLLPAAEWFAVRLVDFGIAKLLPTETEEVARLTTSGLRLGTPSNMAPEQILGLAVDERTDIYALGVLLFQMLTGDLPFSGDTPAEVQEMHLRVQPPHVHARMAISTTVDAVVQRCLEKSPDRRYRCVNDVLEDLRRAVSPSSGPEPTAGPRAIAVYVELSTTENALDERYLDEQAKLVDDARAELAEAGFALTVDAAAVLVAVKPVPVAHEQAARAETIDLALRLLHAASATSLVNPSVIVHVGGDVLSLGRWTPHARAGCVVATVETLQGIEELFVTSAVDTTLARAIRSRRQQPS